MDQRIYRQAAISFAVAGMEATSMPIEDTIYDRQRAVVARMRAMSDLIKTEDRGFNTEERSEWEKLCEASEDLRKRAEAEDQLRAATDSLSSEKRDEDQRLAYQQGRRSYELPPEGKHGADRPMSPAECRQAFRGWAAGAKAVPIHRAMAERAGWVGNEVELFLPREDGVVPKTKREVNAIYEQRALISTQGTNPQLGGYTVADDLMRAIDIAMLAFGNVRGVATVIPTDTGGPLPIPTVNDTTNVGRILGENTAATATDPTFAQLVLDSFKYSSDNVIVSVEFLQDSTLNVGSFMGAILGERIGRLTNQHFTTGTGSAQPRGIVTAATTSGITTASNTAITFSELLNVKHSVDVAYRNGAAWMCDDAIYLQMKKMLDTTNVPMFVQDLQGGAQLLLDGDPIVINNDMATGSASRELIYGQFSKYIVREVRGITLLRLDERYAEQHSVAFLAFVRFDGDLLNAGTNPVKFLTAAT